MEIERIENVTKNHSLLQKTIDKDWKKHTYTHIYMYRNNVKE